MEKKAVNKKTWIIIGIVVVLLAVLGVGGYAISWGGGAGREESLLELGQRYLEELNYEQAVVCFEGYLEIDPQCVEAYARLAEAYVGLGEYEKAMEVLAEGYAITGDGSLQELRSRIEEQYREILMAEETPEHEEEPASSPVPYIIKQGDTLIGICIAFYGSDAMVQEVCNYNGITNPDDIKVGQQILLP